MIYIGIESFNSLRSPLNHRHNILFLDTCNLWGRERLHGIEDNSYQFHKDLTHNSTSTARGQIIIERKKLKYVFGEAILRTPCVHDDNKYKVKWSGNK